LYSKLRELHKQIAEEEGIPFFSVFNNAKLAEIVQNKVDNMQSLSLTDGVGQARPDLCSRQKEKIVWCVSRLSATRKGARQSTQTHE